MNFSKTDSAYNSAPLEAYFEFFRETGFQAIIKPTLERQIKQFGVSFFFF